MIAAILLAVATPMSAIDAERAFAADAQTIGQWTAFRKWSAPQAVMFAPHPVNAHEYLKEAKDPPAALNWSPAESYVSCDGSVAVNTGPWSTSDAKRFGFFTTVWKREGDSWRWLYDGGDALKTPRAQPESPTVRRASCEGKPLPLPTVAPAPGFESGQGSSADHSLHWMWSVSDKGVRRFTARLWNGRAFEDVVTDEVAAPPQ